MANENTNVINRLNMYDSGLAVVKTIIDDMMNDSGDYLET